MNHNTLLRLDESISILGARKDIRKKVVHIIVITERGIGEIVNISRGGLSFGCIYPRTFPDSWHMDILDTMGSHVKDLRVRKIWERTFGYANSPMNFELEVGVEYIDITCMQAAELEHLFKNLNSVAKQTYPQSIECSLHGYETSCYESF